MFLVNYDFGGIVGAWLGRLLHLQVRARIHRRPLSLMQPCIVGEGAPHPSETGCFPESAFWDVVTAFETFQGPSTPSPE